MKKFIRFIMTKLFPPSRTPNPPTINLSQLPFDTTAERYTLGAAISEYESAVTSPWKDQECATLLNSLYVRTVYHQKSRRSFPNEKQHEYLICEVLRDVPGVEIQQRPRMWVRFERRVARKDKVDNKGKWASLPGRRSETEGIATPSSVTGDRDTLPNFFSPNSVSQNTGSDSTEHSRLSDVFPDSDSSHSPARDNDDMSSIDNAKLSSGFSYGAGDFVSFRPYHLDGKQLHSFTFLEESEPDDVEVGDGSNQTPPALNFRSSQNLRVSASTGPQVKATVRLSLHDVLLAARSITREFPDYDVYAHQCFFFASLLWTILVDPQTQRGRLRIRAGKTVSGTIGNGKIGFPFTPPQQDHLDRVMSTYESEKARFLVDKETVIRYEGRLDEEARKRVAAEQLAAEEFRKRLEADARVEDAERKRVEAEQVVQDAAEKIRALEAALEASRNASTVPA